MEWQEVVDGVPLCHRPNVGGVVVPIVIPLPVKHLPGCCRQEMVRSGPPAWSCQTKTIEIHIWTQKRASKRQKMSLPAASDGPKYPIPIKLQINPMRGF